MLLSDKEIEKGLHELNGWRAKNDQLQRDFEFKNFVKAIAFVNRIAEIAQQNDHHPDILVHDWNKVMVMVTTHNAGGITTKDVNLAKNVDAIRIE